MQGRGAAHALFPKVYALLGALLDFVHYCDSRAARVDQSYCEALVG